MQRAMLFIDFENFDIAKYNYYKKKFTIINKKKFLKIKTNPLSYPKGAMMIPQMELE